MPAKQQGADDAETERYYLERLQAAKEGVSDEAMLGLFSSIEDSLKVAAEAVELSRLANDRAELKSGCISEKNDGHNCMPGFWVSEKRIKALKEMVVVLAEDSEDEAGGESKRKGLIAAWQSDKESRRARDAAGSGNMKTLLELQASRSKWPEYLTMASWDEPDHRGCTALHLAASAGHIECVTALLCWNANPAVQNGNGETALHIATSADIARALLMHGSDPASMDRLGRTPYMTHKQNRLGGDASSAAGQVVSAFASHQQITGVAARAISRSRRQLLAAATQCEADRRAADARSHYDVALGHMLRKEYRPAIAAFASCLEVDPSQTKARASLVEAHNFVIYECYNRGLGALALREWDSACAAFEDCITTGQQQQQANVAVKEHPTVARATAKLKQAMDAAATAAFEKEALAVFQALDTDGDGSLSPQELACRLSDFGLGDLEIERILFLLDSNHDGVVDQSEWLAGYAAFRQATTGSNDAVINHAHARFSNDGARAGNTQPPPSRPAAATAAAAARSPPVTPEEGFTRVDAKAAAAAAAAITRPLASV